MTESATIYRDADRENIEMPADRIADGFVMRAMVDKGFHYLLDGQKVPFLDDTGRQYCGLLDGAGGPLPHGSPVVFLWHPIRKAQ